MPALRERPEDIPLLVARFAADYGKRFGRAIAHIEERSLRLLNSYSWPGNVRELENVVERAVIVSRNGTLRIDRDALPNPGPAPGVRIGEDLRLRERDAIEAALRGSRGRVSGSSGAAAKLGMPASTVEFRIKRLGIDKFRFR